MLPTDPEIERLIRANNRSLSRERELRKRVARLEAALVETQRLHLAEPSSNLALAILDGIPDLVFVANAAGAFTYVNYAARKVLGYSREELLALFVSDVASGHRESALRVFARFVSTGMWRDHMILTRKDRSTIKVEGRAVALPGDIYLGVFREAVV